MLRDGRARQRRGTAGGVGILAEKLKGGDRIRFFCLCNFFREVIYLFLRAGYSFSWLWLWLWLLRLSSVREAAVEFCGLRAF